jgi:CheY-like chemotaxis protein
MSQACINLTGMTTLLADSDHFTRRITAQILRGFGAEPCVLADTGEEAINCIRNNCFDLCVLEATFPDMFCGNVIRWLRRVKDSRVRFMPVLVLTSYTQLRQIAAARDAGANLVARKPLSPQTLFDRVTWMARAARPFVETGLYVGPDRRFKNVVPADGLYKRDDDAMINDASPSTSDSAEPPPRILSEAM